MEVEIEANEEDFEEKVIENSKKFPVVVDFWASWCPPCRILSPIISKVAKEYGGKFLLVKVNVDENPILAEKYQIASIPSVKMFKNGKIVDEFLGYMPEPLIKKWLDKNLM
ncbi:MAG: thioredoxin [Candidatus Aenigmatarchaeota archaeon]